MQERTEQAQETTAKQEDNTVMPDISGPMEKMLDRDSGGGMCTGEPIEIDPEELVLKEGPFLETPTDLPLMKLYYPYQRTNTAEMRPYIANEDMSNISVADVDTPEFGGMVARNPQNHDDKWYVAQEYFEDNFAPIFDHEDLEKLTQEKTLKNSDVSGARENVPDLTVFGDGDMFKLLCKASSDLEGWMKSTKAMEIPGVGCVVQVTTQQGGNIAEALTFVPGTRIIGNAKKGRQIVKL